MDIQKELSGIRKRVKLASHTTFKIGGPAEYFFEAKTKESLIKAIKTARKFKLPFFILAGGSNILISDKGFKGLIIKNQNDKIQIKDSTVITEAGVKLNELIKICLKESLSGLEWSAGIPGTIGGAIRGNAGAFEKSMADSVERAEVLEINSGLKIKNYETKDCKFDYRTSVFKEKSNLIVLSVEIKLEKDDKKKIKERVEKYLNYRRNKHPLEFPSAGSIFKNPKNNAAGILINQCGLSGLRVGQAQISEKHSNFIVNLGGAKAEDVRKLIDLIKKKVKEKFNIQLEEEIQFLGFN